MLTNEILSSIDNIDDCVMEAEMNVINAMINEYDKAIMIMENYNGNDYSSFDIFMEADESTEGEKKPQSIFGSKGENIIKRILLIIPRLIATLVRSIKKKWDNRKSQQLIKRIEFLENLTQDQKKQLTELQGGLDKTNIGLKKTNLKIDDNTTRIYEMGKNNDLYNKSVAKSMDDINSRLTSVDRQIKNLQFDVGDENTKSHQMSKDLRKVVRVIDFMNGIVKTTLNCDAAKSYLQNI